MRFDAAVKFRFSRAKRRLKDRHTSLEPISHCTAVNQEAFFALLFPTNDKCHNINPYLKEIIGSFAATLRRG